MGRGRASTGKPRQHYIFRKIAQYSGLAERIPDDEIPEFPAVGQIPGQEDLRSALPGGSNNERIPKRDILAGFQSFRLKRSGALFFNGEGE